MSESHQNLSGIEKEIAKTDLKAVVTAEGRLQMTHLTGLSKRLGKNQGYLFKKLQNADINVALVIALSILLRKNLFELYLRHLPDDLRETIRERDLKKQITTLESDLAAMKRERDLLMEIVKR